MNSEVSTAEYWEERYRSGETGWDLGGPCPVFVELLGGPRAPPPGRVAFPGCGHGHDVRLFAERGYDAVGFDFALSSADPPIERMDVFDLGRRYPEAFHTIVEYTCYCAIDPERREEYAGVLWSALKPGGLLVALLFPVERKPEGPPFGIDEAEIEDVLARDLGILEVTTPESSVDARRGRERLVLARKGAG